MLKQMPRHIDFISNNTVIERDYIERDYTGKDRDYMELYELQSLVREGIEAQFPERVWVRAEIASINSRMGGHCYLELVQSEDGRLIAKSRAVIWSSKWRVLKPFFESVTGSSLEAGMEVLVSVQLSYSELYGFALNIVDINPEFTLGKNENLRRQTIKRLEDEKLMDLQKSLEAPALPYRFAVVTSETAAGYGDFTRHLAENGYGFVYDTELFPAMMQGSDCPSSIAEALAEIESCGKAYDAVLVLRGGGSDTDLACFDDYSLCRAIALCPFPVFTAVGHEKDFHVCDMVANRYFRTPTALADELIGIFADADACLTQLSQRIRMALTNRLNAIESKMEMLALRIRTADPRSILRRGYALVVDADGKPRKSAANFREGDRMSVMFSDGTVNAEVVDVTPGSDVGDIR